MKSISHSLPNNSVINQNLLRAIITTICIVISFSFLCSQEVKQYENFDPTNFDENSINITNDWMPLQPGTRFVYAGTTFDEEEDEAPLPHRVIINVTDLVKEINGVNCVVTWDLDYSQGMLVEAELAFFAQDKEGNVWRMGEYPEEYEEDGEVEAAPCWFSGIEDAVAGISMRAHPFMGTPSYSQGWGPEVDFTDRGQVTNLGMTLCVPMDCYENILEISETSLEEPDAFQLKYWAEGVGNVQVGYKGEDPSQELLELVDVFQFSPEGIKVMRDKALALEKRAYERKGNKKTYHLTKPCTTRN